MKRLVLFLLALVSVMGLFIAYGVGTVETYSNTMTVQTAKVICDKAHDEINGASEQACGDAQDKTGTEYLCDQTNSYCWLEVK